MAIVTRVGSVTLAASGHEVGWKRGRVCVERESTLGGVCRRQERRPGRGVDLRYATPNNFTRAPLYPADARCLVHESMAPGLTAAANALRRHREVLVFWDCYRPHEAQVRMFQAVPDPAWVARCGAHARSHESGRSVDVTTAREQCRQTAERCLVDMGTDFDDFTPRAYALATDGVSANAQANRVQLLSAMSGGGLTVYSGECWHFDGPGAAADFQWTRLTQRVSYSETTVPRRA